MQALIRCQVITFGISAMFSQIALGAGPPLGPTNLSDRAVVAADHPAASAAGAAILQQGGNAVDAAVATSFALSVCRPGSCGIGGGGFMMIWDARSRTATAIDYRERAPAAASRDMYALAQQQYGVAAEPYSVRGGMAVGIPGTPAGLCYAAQRYGTLPLADLLAPAIALCENGVEIDAHDISVQRTTLQKLQKYPDYTHRFATLMRDYLNQGVPWKSGDRFYSPQLPTLRAIAAQGADGFYAGDVADAIIRATSAEHGVMTLDDLKIRLPAERIPVATTFRGAAVFSMPPPSSGGIALIQTLQTLQSWETRSGRSLTALQHNSADYIHVVTEAIKHAFADRAEFLGDTDFAEVPVKRLLAPDYSAETARRIDLQKTLPSAAYGRFFSAPDSGTSHFSVIDTHGNAVACTETINLTFGSFVIVPEYGIVLNNQMDDFAANPGEPNAFGLMQSEANVVHAGKKPLSSMTPTLVIRDGRAVFACGASGGPRIITATIQTLLNNQVFGMAPADAVAAPRFHHQWYPDELLLEHRLFEASAEDLRSRGHTVEDRSALAVSQAAALKASARQVTVLGGSDPRSGGKPVSVEIGRRQ